MGELRLSRNSDATVLGDWKEWIPRDLPQETIRVRGVPERPPQDASCAGLELLAAWGVGLRKNSIHPSGVGVLYRTVIPLNPCSSGETLAFFLPARLVNTERQPCLQPEGNMNAVAETRQHYRDRTESRNLDQRLRLGTAPPSLRIRQGKQSYTCCT